MHKALGITSIALSLFVPAAFADPTPQAHTALVEIFALDPTSEPILFDMQASQALPPDSVILAKKDGKKVGAYKVLPSSNPNAASSKRFRVKLTTQYLLPLPGFPWEGAVKFPENFARLEIGVKDSKIQPLDPSETEHTGSRRDSIRTTNRERASLGASIFIGRQISSFTTSALKDLTKDPYWAFGGLLGYQLGPYFRAAAGASVSTGSMITWTTFHGGLTAFVPGWNLTPIFGLNADYTPYSFASADALYSSRLLTLGVPLGLDYQHKSGAHFSLAFYPIQWSSFSLKYGQTTFSTSETRVFKDMPLIFQIGFYLGVSDTGRDTQSATKTY